MPLPPVYQERDIMFYQHGLMESGSATIVSEIPLTICLNGTKLATLVCSPIGYRELAAGFLLNEGLAPDPLDIKDISVREDEGLLWVETYAPAPQVENFLRRQIAGRCGKGRVSPYFVNDARQLQPVQSTYRFKASDILRLIAALEENSTTFRRTGGVHSAALADSTGLLVMFEDIGRHNAVDKVLGHTFINRIATSDKMMLLSGRVSSEILIKVVRTGLPLVVSRSAPTLLAVELAEQFGITIVGFARGRRFSVYSHTGKVMA